MKYLLLIITLFFIYSCGDDRKPENYFKKNKVKSEYYFVDNPEGFALPGELIIVQLERQNQINNDTIYYKDHIPKRAGDPVFPDYKDTETRGIDKIPYQIPETAIFNYRLESNSPYTIKFFNASNNLIFELNQSKLEVNQQLDAGDYYFIFEHLEEFGKPIDSLRVTPIYMQPDLTRLPADVDPYGAGSEYLLKDLFTYFSSKTCIECDFSVNFKEIPEYMDSLYMSDTDFRGSTFEFNNLSWSNFENCNFSNSNGHVLNMSSGIFEYCHFDNSNFANVNDYSNSVFFHSIFTNTNMENAFGRRVSFERADLDSANLRGIEFENSEFSGTSFLGSDLTGAILRKGNFNYSFFRYSILDGAIFFGSQFDNITIRNSSCIGASFCGVLRVGGFIKNNIMNSDSAEYNELCQYNVPTRLFDDEEDDGE